MRAVDSRSHPVSEFLRAVCCAAKQYLFQLELGILVLADALTGLYIAAESGHWSSSYRGDIREQAPSLVAGDSREFNAHPFLRHGPPDNPFKRYGLVSQTDRESYRRTDLERFGIQNKDAIHTQVPDCSGPFDVGDVTPRVGLKPLRSALGLFGHRAHSTCMTSVYSWFGQKSHSSPRTRSSERGVRRQSGQGSVHSDSSSLPPARRFNRTWISVADIARIPRAV